MNEELNALRFFKLLCYLSRLVFFFLVIVIILVQRNLIPNELLNC